MTGRKELTSRQREVLACLQSELEKNHYAPTVREIGEQVGFSSTSSVKYQLDALESKGYIVRNAGRSRTILLTEKGYEALGITSPEQPSPALVTQKENDQLLHIQNKEYSSLASQDTASHHIPNSPSRQTSHMRHLTSVHGITREPHDLPGSDEPQVDHSVFVPVVGRIAAGSPILADQLVEDVFPLPRTLTGQGELFMLKVAGDSMIDAAICDGDYVVIRRQPVAENGEIVAAMLDGEATVKVFQRKNGHIKLLPRNPDYAPIPADEAQILGKVVTVLRAL